MPEKLRLLAKNHPLPVLPALSFFALAAQVPLVVQNGTIYYVGEETAVEPCLLFADTAYSLLSAQSLAEVETNYYVQHQTQLEQYKLDYLQRVVDEEIKSLRQLQQQLAENDLLTFLLLHLQPQLAALDMRQEQPPAPSGENRPPVMVAPARGREPHPHFSQPHHLYQAIGEHALFLDGNVYTLEPVSPPPDSDLIIRVCGRAYGLTQCRFLTEVEQTFTAQVAEALQDQALAEAPDRQQWLNELKAELANMQKRLPPSLVAGQDGYLYRSSRWGIMRQQGNWIVYQEVPEYVIEGNDQRLYRFKATRVGLILLNLQREQILAAGRARVLTPYAHMFVNATVSGESICMAKSDAYYQQLRRMPLAQAICTYLHDAAQTLMAGYHAGNSNNPYHPITNFAAYTISRQEATHQGLPVFPYNR